VGAYQAVEPHETALPPGLLCRVVTLDEIAHQTGGRSTMEEQHLAHGESALDDDLVDLPRLRGHWLIAQLRVEVEVVASPRDPGRRVQSGVRIGLGPPAETQVVDLVRGHEVSHATERVDLVVQIVTARDGRPHPQVATVETDQGHLRGVGEPVEPDLRAVRDPDLVADRLQAYLQKL